MLVQTGRSKATLSFKTFFFEFHSPLAGKPVFPTNLDASGPKSCKVPSLRPTWTRGSKVMINELLFAGRGTFWTIVTVITLSQPGFGELWLMSFFVNTELGCEHDSGTGVVVEITVVGAGVVDVVAADDVLDVVGAGVVLDVVRTGVVLEVVAARVVLEVVGAGVVLDVVGLGVVLDVVGLGVVLEVVGTGVVLLLVNAGVVVLV